MTVKYVVHGELHIHPDYVAVLREAGLDSLQALLETPGDADLIKPGLASWRQRLVVMIAGRRYYLKRYRQPPPDEQRRQRRLGFGSTAQIEFQWIAALREVGIGCPTAVAFGQRCHGDVEQGSVLLTAEMTGMSLEKWVRTPAAAVALRDRAVRTRLVLALADLTHELHDAGLYHRDYYLSHIFIDMNDDMRLALIDLQRMIRSRRRGRWGIKDLASLHYSAAADVFTCTDRIRFYRRYFGRPRLGWLDRLTIRMLGWKKARIARHSRRHALG